MMCIKIKTIWMTYGQFREWPSGRKLVFVIICLARVVQRNAFREYSAIPSHLRTFYAGLFKKIKKEDLMYAGQFLANDGRYGCNASNDRDGT